MTFRLLNITFFLAMLAALAAPAASFAQTIEAQKKKVAKIEEDIRFLDKQIELTRQQQKNTLDELVLLQRKVANRKRLLDELDNEIKIQGNRIDSLSGEIKHLENRLDTLSFYYGHLVRNAYKNRDTRTWFMYILASDNVEQGYRRLIYLKNYSRSINKQVIKIQQTKEEIISRKEKLTGLKAENLKIQQARAKEYQELTREEQHSRTYSKALANKQREYKTQLAQKKKEADRLNKEVEKMIAEAIRQEQLRKQKEEEARLAASKKSAQPQQDNKTAQPPKSPSGTDIKLSGDFGANKGKLPWPVERGVVIESFGEHKHPTLPNVKLPFNNGVNISAPKGSPVKVVFDGTVKQVIAMPGYNQCILVQHGGYFTFYCKLDKVTVKTGDTVRAGDILGSLDDTRNTAVLHFELWNGTTKQNPEFWLQNK